MATTISLAELIRRISRFSPPQEAGEILAENKPAILELVRSQMFHGLNGNDGGQIGHYQEQKYAYEKYEMNPAAGFGNVDLRLTGTFYERLEARLTGSGDGSTLGITSTDSKAPALEKKYKLYIYKLNTESKNTLKKTVLQPGLVHRFIEKVGGQIG